MPVCCGFNGGCGTRLVWLWEREEERERETVRRQRCRFVLTSALGFVVFSRCVVVIVVIVVPVIAACATAHAQFVVTSDDDDLILLAAAEHKPLCQLSYKTEHIELTSEAARPDIGSFVLRQAHRSHSHMPYTIHRCLYIPAFEYGHPHWGKLCAARGLISALHAAQPHQRPLERRQQWWPRRRIRGLSYWQLSAPDCAQAEDKCTGAISHLQVSIKFETAF